jgi:hypothetical protein
MEALDWVDQSDKTTALEAMMKPRKLLALGLVAAMPIAVGCSSNGTRIEGQALIFENPFSPNDTTPIFPPPPPSPPIPPVVFGGADSTQAGSIGVTRWWLGNDGKAPFTVHWTLSDEQGWPGLPIQGALEIPARQQRLLEVPVSVPASATSSMYPLRITVDRPGGLTTTGDGGIRVFGNDPPPPPPPPFAAVEFIGSDSISAGQSGFSRWRLGNESDQPFTMSWTLRGNFTRQGTVDLLPLERRVLAVEIAVPDTAAAGERWLEMHVTRPNGADGWAYGRYWVRP